MASSAETVRALSAVIHAVVPDVITEMSQALEVGVRDVERARMSAEDLRAASLSRFTDVKDPHYRRLTWRTFGEERREMPDLLDRQVLDAADTLRAGRRDARAASDNLRPRDPFAGVTLRRKELHEPCHRGPRWQRG